MHDPKRSNFVAKQLKWARRIQGVWQSAARRSEEDKIAAYTATLFGAVAIIREHGSPELAEQLEKWMAGSVEH